MISRRTFIKGACGYVLGVMSVGSYSCLLEPRWIEIKNVFINIRALPERFEGMRIAQLSDIHHCKYVPREFIKKCVRKVNALSPDIIALTGDFVYGSKEFLSSVAEELSELKAKEGVFAVLGNHDNKDVTADTLAKRGIRVLINEHVPLYRKKDYLFIAGVDDLWAGKLNLETTLKGVDSKPKILLCHNPDAIERIKHTGIDFVMAGHTHGGQVCLPLYGPPIVYSKFGTRYASGLFHEERTIMYVNKGIGVSNFPVRFFARPEITLFTLQNSLQSV
ncbi:MAG TPA: metallophosphoesterase, partial [Candidatus Wunengus sp. YC60]|uniref:metallophosphoesterase n=1 Tax=Candidatus Wunengus sp. YC60 TaxID=3367697 RepID=UPI004027E749